jgi:hypothetical protein
MDHLTYLDHYNAMTAPALDELAIMLGRIAGADEAQAYLASLRTSQDALWDQYRASASQQVAP